MKTTIAILGIGLIGGSLALSLKEEPSHHIIGFDVHEANINKALTKGIIDEGTTVLQTAVEDADVIILAAPVEQIRILLRQLASLNLKAGAIVSDVGSTKSGIVKYASVLAQKQVTFIGGHPMAGSHKSGVEAANPRLFENAYYVLTPSADATDEQVERLRQLLHHTHAQVVVMQPDEHDEVVGAVSHFPHIIAALLVNQVSTYNEEKEWHHRLAAGGFRDITRIASSNPRMWRDILLNNRDYMIKIATDWRQGFEHIMTLVATGDADGIEQFFSNARDARDNLPERRRGAMEPLLDLYIDIPDHPGEIGRITTLLGSKQISITNIQIHETREEQLGALRITFRNEQELEKGAELLRYFDYHVYGRD